MMKATNMIAALGMLLITIPAIAQTDVSLIPYRSGDKWGYSTASKQVIIEPAFAEAGWFSEGYAAVKIGNRYGYINKTGKLVIPAKFTVAKPFRKGYLPNEGKIGGDSVLFAGASTAANGYEICINTKGNRMAKCPAINEAAAIENKTPLLTVTEEKKYSLPNNKDLFDKIADDYQTTNNGETYYIAVKDNRYGVFNSKFETIVPFEYSNIRLNRNKHQPFLEVNKGGMFGVLMPDGSTSIAPEYSMLKSVDGIDGNEYILIRKDGKTYVKDVRNRDIISSGFADISYDNAGFVITSNEQLKGYYFTDNRVIQPKYREIHMDPTVPYLVVKTASGKRGYVGINGEEYFTE